jgi:hypothetical protein
VTAALLSAAGLAAAAALLLPGAQSGPDRTIRHGARGAGISKSEWGRVQYFNGLIVFTLAPTGDRRRRHELSFDEPFTAAGLAISNGETKATPLEGTPMGVCGYHWQGIGFNAIATTGACVPLWATTATGHHARVWVRVENLMPVARVVVLQYEPKRQQLTLLPWVA